MNRRSMQPAPGHYRLAVGIRIVDEMAIRSYPLRVVRLGATATRLLLLCAQSRTCEELAQDMNLPVQRVSALCEQLRWKGLLEAGPLRPPATWPNVSIIIPTRNREEQLGNCLRSLLEVEYSSRPSCPALEIIVVDDASAASVATLLQPFLAVCEARGIALRIIRNAQQQGVAKCRNIGAEAAQYELLAYIDSDCVASPGWLTELVPAFQDWSLAAVGGMIRAYERQSLLGRYEDVRSSLFMGLRTQQVRLEGPLTYLATANLLVRRANWRASGGFAPLTFGEDVDFCRRQLASGSRILYLPQGVVYHDYRTKLWLFLRIRASYASAEAALLKRHPNERRVLVLPPEQATFAGLVVGGIWGMWLGICRAWRDRARWEHGSTYIFPAFSLIFAILWTLFGVRNRMQKIRQQHIPIGPLAVIKATVRGHLAYTYHLCRHLTRYYTLPMLLLGVLVPPLLLLVFLVCSIVIGVDYVRLGPQMGIGQYALCSLLDDCAYEVGVVIGCIKQRTWKPLVPIVRKKNAL